MTTDGEGEEEETKLSATSAVDVRSASQPVSLNVLQTNTSELMYSVVSVQLTVSSDPTVIFNCRPS